MRQALYGSTTPASWQTRLPLQSWRRKRQRRQGQLGGCCWRWQCCPSRESGDLPPCFLRPRPQECLEGASPQPPSSSPLCSTMACLNRPGRGHAHSSDRGTVRRGNGNGPAHWQAQSLHGTTLPPSGFACPHLLVLRDPRTTRKTRKLGDHCPPRLQRALEPTETMMTTMTTTALGAHEATSASATASSETWSSSQTSKKAGGHARGRVGE